MGYSTLWDSLYCRFHSPRLPKAPPPGTKAATPPIAPASSSIVLVLGILTVSCRRWGRRYDTITPDSPNAVTQVPSMRKSRHEAQLVSPVTISTRVAACPDADRASIRRLPTTKGMFLDAGCLMAGLPSSYVAGPAWAHKRRPAAGSSLALLRQPWWVAVALGARTTPPGCSPRTTQRRRRRQAVAPSRPALPARDRRRARGARHRRG